MGNNIRNIIRDEIQKYLLEVSDHFYGQKKDGTSIKISYENFVLNLEKILKDKKNISLEELVNNKDWKSINSYLEDVLKDLSDKPDLSTDFKFNKSSKTHDNKSNIISKLRTFINSYYSDVKKLKRKKEAGNV